MTTTQYTKQIPCREHPQGDHTAVLYTFGHQYAGIWECPITGASDSCEHNDTHVEETVQDHLGAQGHYQTEHSIYVCDDCECQVDGDPEADAAEERADAEADSQRDE
jgi:hypothetical protein